MDKEEHVQYKEIKESKLIEIYGGKKSSTNWGHCVINTGLGALSGTVASIEGGPVFGAIGALSGGLTAASDSCF